MTKQVSSFNAKTHLANLLNQVQQGEEFIKHFFKLKFIP